MPPPVRSSSGKKSQRVGVGWCAGAERGPVSALPSALPSHAVLVPSSPGQLCLIPSTVSWTPWSKVWACWITCPGACVSLGTGMLSCGAGGIGGHGEGAQHPARARSAVDSHSPHFNPRESDEPRRTRLNSRTNGVLKSTLLMSGLLSRSKMTIF